jgi:hypothetical protein
MLHATAHWKVTIHLYLLSKSQVHRKIIASTVACPKQQKPFFPPHETRRKSQLE